MGREQVIEELAQKLCSSPGEQSVVTSPRAVVIRGWPGVGKSTVAAALAYVPAVLESFEGGVLWASLGQEPDILVELANWGHVLGSSSVMGARNVQEASGLLRGLLRERRCLLVIDDLWALEHAAAFRVAGPECAVLITTRLPVLAGGLATTPEDVYVLSVLDDGTSLKLLSVLAPTAVRGHVDDALQLVKELEGLPLALQVAGRMLNAEAELGWGVSDLLHEIRQDACLLQASAPADCVSLLSETTPNVAALLRKSTARLAPSDRECFAMLGVFAPKPATFDIPAMSAVWEVDNPKPIVRTLVGRGLLEPVGGGRFWMHALLAAHARTLLEG